MPTLREVGPRLSTKPALAGRCLCASIFDLFRVQPLNTTSHPRARTTSEPRQTFSMSMAWLLSSRWAFVQLYTNLFLMHIDVRRLLMFPIANPILISLPLPSESNPNSSSSRHCPGLALISPALGQKSKGPRLAFRSTET